MAKAVTKRGRRNLQQAFDAMLEEWPRNYATGLVKRKLSEAGVKPTRRLVAKLVDGAFAGIDEFELPGHQRVTLEITTEDLADLDRASEQFLDDLPKLVEEVGTKT